MTGRSLLGRLRGLLAGRVPAPAAALAAPLSSEPVVLSLWLEDGPALVDLDICPREQRRRPLAVSDDSSRRCFHCGHTIPGRTR
ncbi:hypothetical protein ACFOOM_01265 [Streptomyces echinoruber]|uniref:Uncharacterized protein n=1 Tax=Streptomyces echinoruber TaxID=68898 RepID=A0A918V6C8_9ACTN|nr:hypothetical protein [Streptomyces echinoruber]GGZ72851.1 hypothetical protein GCM10010389_07780 [Streptomyces echinoruber]